MDETTTTPKPSPLLGAGWSDALEDEVRGRVRAIIEGILEEALSAALGTAPLQARRDCRVRLAQRSPGPAGDRHVRREIVRVPRARLACEDRGTAKWRSQALRRYQRLTERAEALIADAYLAGPTRAGCAGPWRRCPTARSARTSSAAPGARFGPAGQRGTTATSRVRTSSGSSSTSRWFERRSTSRPRPSRCWWRSACASAASMQAVLKNMGGESTAARIAFLEDMTRRGLNGPEFVIVDGAPGHEAALRCLARRPGPPCTPTWRPVAGVPAQVAAEVPGRHRQPRRSRRPALHLHAPAAGPMEISPHHQCHRAPA